MKFFIWAKSQNNLGEGPSTENDTKHSRSLLKSNQITFIVTSPQHKCLGEWNSYERAPDSAKKNNKQFTYGQTVQKKLHWSIYSAPDSAKKQQQQFTYGQTVQKNNKQFTYGQTVQKKQQTIYIWTDSAKKTALEHLQCSRQCKKNNNNLHMDSTYLQTVQKTMCKIHIHILSTHSVL